MYLKFHQMKWGRVKQWDYCICRVTASRYCKKPKAQRTRFKKAAQCGIIVTAVIKSLMHSKLQTQRKVLQVLGPRKTSPPENLHTSVTTVALTPLIRWITHTDTHSGSCCIIEDRHSVHVCSFTNCHFNWIMSYFWPAAEGFHFNVYNIHRYYHKLFFKKALLTHHWHCSSFSHQKWVISLSEAQEDALVLTHAQ